MQTCLPATTEAQREQWPGEAGLSVIEVLVALAVLSAMAIAVATSGVFQTGPSRVEADQVRAFLATVLARALVDAEPQEIMLTSTGLTGASGKLVWDDGRGNPTLAVTSQRPLPQTIFVAQDGIFSDGVIVVDGEKRTIVTGIYFDRTNAGRELE